MFCSSCGTATDGGAVACAQCGTDLPLKVRPPLNADRAVAASTDAARAVKLLLTDPVGSIGSAYDAFTPARAMDVGIAFSALFIVSSLIAVRTIARATLFGFGSIGFKEVMQVLLLAAIPVASVIAILMGLQLVVTKRNDPSRAIFAAGAALLPMSILNVAAGLLSFNNGGVLAVVALFAACYMSLLLYAGCRDVLKVSSAAAAIAVPAIILVTGWVTKIVISAL
ncbi:MAG: hypothetical protein ABI779_25765 [Acidobacteriota bacterium]